MCHGHDGDDMSASGLWPTIEDDAQLVIDMVKWC
jgi:hypothetical protein